MGRSTRAKNANATPTYQPVGIQQLDDDLLARILLLIPQGQRIRTAEVCKAWDQLLRRRGMWFTAEYPRRQLSSPVTPESDGNISLHGLHWLASRCRATRALRVEGEVQDAKASQRMVDGKFKQLLTAFATASALVDLRVQLPDHVSIASSSLNHVKLLGGLTKLHLHGVRPPVTANDLNSLFSTLPALQACSLGVTARPRYPSKVAGSKVGVPDALYTCTQLTSLAVFDLTGDHNQLDWGGLSDGITALQRLAQLRLQNVLTAPLTTAISALTYLTSIGLHSENYDIRTTDIGCEPLLPAAAAVLPALQQLDIDGFPEPSVMRELIGPDVQAFAGVRDLTLRDFEVRPVDLAIVGCMRHLSRLRFSKCLGSFDGGESLTGLDSCIELRQMNFRDCSVQQLAPCKVLQQGTELGFQYTAVSLPILACVAEAMPQLITLDLSHSSSKTRVQPGKLIEDLQRCASLQRLVYETPHDELNPQLANDLMEVQRAVPRVRWQLTGAPNDHFDETRALCSKNYFGQPIKAH